MFRYGNIWTNEEFYEVTDLGETWASLEATDIINDINVKWPQGLQEQIRRKRIFISSAVNRTTH